jgi:hypothetical protein
MGTRVLAHGGRALEGIIGSLPSRGGGAPGVSLGGLTPGGVGIVPASSHLPQALGGGVGTSTSPLTPSAGTPGAGPASGAVKVVGIVTSLVAFVEGSGQSQGWTDAMDRAVVRVCGKALCPQHQAHTHTHTQTHFLRKTLCVDACAVEDGPFACPDGGF